MTVTAQLFVLHLSVK